MSRPVHQAAKRHGTTSADIFDRLIEAVLSGQFTAGSPLREAKLAREWHVSRTPMREAVRRAAEAGFLILRPNQAPLVRQLTAADIHDLYDLRELLELHALRLAWPRIDKAALQALDALARRAAAPKAAQLPLDFDIALHRLWMDRCGNSWLRADLEWLFQFLQIIQNWMSADTGAMRHAYEEHVAILEALRAGQPTVAVQRLRYHIRHAGKVVCATLTAKQSLSS